MVYKTMDEIFRNKTRPIELRAIPFVSRGNDSLVNTVLGNRGIEGKSVSVVGIGLALGIGYFASQIYQGEPIMPQITSSIKSYFDLQN